MLDKLNLIDIISGAFILSPHYYMNEMLKDDDVDSPRSTGMVLVFEGGRRVPLSERRYGQLLNKAPDGADANAIAAVEAINKATLERIKCDANERNTFGAKVIDIVDEASSEEAEAA